MSNLQAYLVTIGIVVIICLTPVGKILQSDSILVFSLGMIGILFVFAGIMTLRIKKKQNKKDNIKGRIEAILAEKGRDEHE